MPARATGSSIQAATTPGVTSTWTTALPVVKEAGRRASGSVGPAAIGTVDILVDGLVFGIGFAAGQQQGLLLT